MDFEQLLSRIALALGIGLLIGLERGWRTREAAARPRHASRSAQRCSVPCRMRSGPPAWTICALLMCQSIRMLADFDRPQIG